MPITDMQFEHGIFSCREVGIINEDDAKLWAKHIAHYAARSPHPIVALVDATRAEYLTSGARQVFAKASAIPNLEEAAVATASFRVEQNARMTAMMSVKKHTHIFDNIENALRFSLERANDLRQSAKTR